MKRLLALLAAFAVSALVFAAPANASDVHVCQGSDTTSTGLSAGVCEDGYIWTYNGYVVYALVTEFICHGGTRTIQCSGITAHSQDYVNGWEPSHRLMCGSYVGYRSLCSTGRTFDNAIPSGGRPFGTRVHWIGRIYSTTINNQGALFLFNDYRGLDLVATS